jgi:flavin-dependent dehydrogenase
LHLVKLAPQLAQRTLILERERHPRPKLCAGGIMPGGEAWLRKLGLDLSDVPSVDVHEAHFLFESRGFIVRRQPFLFRIVRRAVARLVYRIHGRRRLLRSLWWNFGSLVGWLAEHRLVDWGE